MKYARPGTLIVYKENLFIFFLYQPNVYEYSYSITYNVVLQRFAAYGADSALSFSDEILDL